MSNQGQTTQQDSLLSLRSALILTLGLLVGGVVTALSLWAGREVPEALLAALASTGTTIALFNKLIGS